MHPAKQFSHCSCFISLVFVPPYYICVVPVCAPRRASLLSETVAEAVSWLAVVILIAARGYGEGGVFRELQDPPWLLPAVPWYCKRQEIGTLRQGLPGMIQGNANTFSQSQWQQWKQSLFWSIQREPNRWRLCTESPWKAGEPRTSEVPAFLTIKRWF